MNHHGNIETVELSKLKPYKNNARFHQPWQIEKIIKSLEEHGWTTPMIVDENYNILAGHGRYMAASRMGRPTVEVRRVFGWTDDQKKAYVLKDNQLTECSEWDESTLRNEIESLLESKYDIDTLGFDEAYIQQLLSDVTEVANTVEDSTAQAVNNKERVLRVSGDFEELRELSMELSDRGFKSFFEMI